jgi:radical SAM superfamily enzyme YgiQ (UPF0313 family)
MKILLIYPYFLEPRLHVEEIAAVPMGLYYIGALLKKQRHHVEILNWYDAKDSEDAVKEALISKKPDVIGFSIVHANRWGGIDIARIAKQLFPDVPVVFGGIGATFLWEHLLTHFKEIDYIVRGEGEGPFAALISAIENGCLQEAAPDIPGLALRTRHSIVKTADAPMIENLDDLPPPARYFDFQHLSMTRGCPGRCTFCGSPEFWRRRVRFHSADYVVNQLEMLAGRGVTYFYLSDDTFTLNAKRVIELCQKIIHRRLNFSWQAISKVSAVNDDMLYWMRKAGCTQISYGVESGSKKIRQQLCKDIRDDQIQQAFHRTVAHGILARAYFIYGAPGETWQTIEQTLDLIRRIKPLSAIFYIMDLFPGTALYETYKKRFGLDDDIWLERIEDQLYYETDTALDQETVSAYGRHLRDTYNRWLPEFARQIVLIDDDTLLSEQADFLSRLGMTFSHGDYARIDSATHPMTVARDLYHQALARHPDHRAFWGLALLHQQLGARDAAIDMLRQGLRHYPHSQYLNICLGIGYADKGQYKRALSCLTPFKEIPEAIPHIIGCLHALGRHREAEKYARTGAHP